MEYLFWTLAVAAVYPYFIYPPMVWLLSKIFGRHGVAPTPEDADLPRVSLLVVAYNEEALIRTRIESALATEYPAGNLEIVIASDGSTDSTVRIVEEFASRGVRCLAFPERRGKATTLKAAAELLTGEVVVLSDANSFFRADAVRSMARWFVDPSVGVVCGRLNLQDNKRNKNCDGLYWRFETWLKQSESRLGALLGSNGAIYAIRRDLLPHLPATTIVDDFELPLIAKMRTGCDLLFESAAVADEETAPKIAVEFNRRVRIGAGVFQSLERLYPLLNPFRGWVAFTFVSHKVLRWAGPFLLVGMAATNALLLGRPIYDAAMMLQFLFYLVALIGMVMPVGALPKYARLPTLFVTVNAALMVGFWRWLFGQGSTIWQPTQRLELAAVAAE
jgi:cellulose synthase/poly-beta-1,6-N-acetylglucosamine synthase-like glycosyltransferase